jgi:hypothetical protein
MLFFRKKSTGTDSFWNWLTGEAPGHDGMASVERTMVLRHRIIDRLRRAGLSENSNLMYRVVNVPDLQGLWFMRPEIMRSLSSLHGEERAGRIMGTITQLFWGLLPETMFRQFKFAV